jgi:hypothetical protein
LASVLNRSPFSADGDRHVAGFTDVDIPHRAGFAFVCAADDGAVIAVFQLAEMLSS